MSATALPGKLRNLRARRKSYEESDQAAQAAAYERSLSGGRSKAEQAAIYRKMAEDLPRIRATEWFSHT